MSDFQSQKKVAVGMDTVESIAELSPQEIADYLKRHPDFFTRHPDVLNALVIPHEQKGSVSLVELQSEQLRKKVRHLTTKLNQLFSVARQNEKLFRVYSQLNVRLLACTQLAEIEQILEEVMVDELGLASVVIKLYHGAHALPELQQRLIVEKRFPSDVFFFGRLSHHEKQLLFGDLPAESVALMQLGETVPMGILAVGSQDASHFTPDMDTLLIKQLREVLNLVLPPILNI